MAATCKRMKLDTYLTPYKQNKTKPSKWIKDLNIRPEIIKFLEENIWNKLLDIGVGNDSLDLTPEAKVAKAKISKRDYIKLKMFCTAKETINKMKRQYTKKKKN